MGPHLSQFSWANFISTRFGDNAERSHGKGSEALYLHGHSKEPETVVGKVAKTAEMLHDGDSCRQ